MVTEVTVAVTIVVTKETGWPACVFVIVTSSGESVTVWARAVVLGVDDTIGSTSLHCAELFTAENIQFMFCVIIKYVYVHVAIDEMKK